MYITFFHNCFMHPNNSLSHELPISTNVPSGKRQVLSVWPGLKTKMMLVKN